MPCISKFLGMSFMLIYYSVIELLFNIYIGIGSSMVVALFLV